MQLIMRARPAALVVVLLAAGSVPIARAAGDIIVGTTDSVQTVDPAKCYSFYCANILHNVGETLVDYPSGGTELVPRLAKAMPDISKDGLTYTFKLHEGVTFQDGSKLTGKDVKFSLSRTRWINHPEGAAFLLSGIESIDTPDDYTVVIHLKSQDISFVSKLAYVAATILPSDAYTSPDKPLGNDAKPGVYEQYIQEELIGSGPYKITDFRQDQSILLDSYADYWGEAPRNDKVLVRFFAKSSQMLVALKSGEIDVAFRRFTPAQRKSLANDEDIKTIKGQGAAIRFMVFNPRLKPVDKKTVRQAIAAALDRSRIIRDDLGGAAKPLYSSVPPAFKLASKTDFKGIYGDKKAADYLDHKVTLTLWYSRGHYGTTEPAVAQTIARTLNETGLFNVSLKSSEWAEFSANAFAGPSGQYAAFLLGFYPDYLDPDDYLGPFYHSRDSFLRVYDNKRMDKLLAAEKTADSPASEDRLKTFADIQKLAAEDVPILPLYVNTPFAFARKTVSGVGDTMGAAQIFHYSVLSKNDD